MTVRNAIVLVALLALVSAHAEAQTSSNDKAAVGRTISRIGTGASRVANVESRLEALSPTNPRGYFELGEEIASEAADDLDRRLGRQLYVLAFELDRASKTPDRALGGSVCLALAAIAETDDERRWLVALGETLAPEGTPDLRRIKTTTTSRDPAAFDLATMLSYVRSGEGRHASKLLEKPEVSRLLDKCDKLLMPGIGGASRVRVQIDQWPVCPQCRGRRSVKDGAGVHLCPTCHGIPGPTLTHDELVGQIRTESVLLSGQQRSWAGAIISDGGAPLRELDPKELSATYGVDLWRPLWRDGVWVADPTSPKPANDSGKDGQVPQNPNGEIAPVSAPGKRAG